MEIATAIILLLIALAKLIAIMLDIYNKWPRRSGSPKPPRDSGTLNFGA